MEFEIPLHSQVLDVGSTSLGPTVSPRSASATFLDFLSSAGTAQLECGADVQDHVPRYKLSKDTKIEIIFEQHFKRPTATLKIYH